MPLGTRIRLVAGGVALLTLIIFLFQNLQSADVNFLWFEWRTRMIWALLASAGFGAASVLLAALVWPRRGDGKEANQRDEGRS